MKCMKKTVTVGIPAHEEGDKIRELIRKILIQENKLFKLNDIVLIYSGNDRENVKEIIPKEKLISVILDKKRTTKNNKIHRMAKNSDSDLLLILDADILIQDNKLIDKLTRPFSIESTLITVPEIIPLNPKNVLQKILFLSHEIKREISKNWNSGDNFLSAIGCSMMYKTNFIKNIDLQRYNSAEDYFLYIKSKEIGGVMKRVNNTSIYFTLPKSIKDHINQSNRFLSNKPLIKNINILKKYGRLSLALKIKLFIEMLKNNIFYTFLYVLILLFSKIISIIKPSDTAYWKISNSTK